MNKTSAIAKWGQKQGPCIGDFCLLEGASYRIGAMRDGAVSFEMSESSNRFHLDADGNMTFAGTLLPSPTAQESSLVPVPGERPQAVVVLPDSSQTRVRCRVFKVE